MLYFSVWMKFLYDYAHQLSGRWSINYAALSALSVLSLQKQKPYFVSLKWLISLFFLFLEKKKSEFVEGFYGIYQCGKKLFWEESFNSFVTKKDYRIEIRLKFFSKCIKVVFSERWSPILPARMPHRTILHNNPDDFLRKSIIGYRRRAHLENVASESSCVKVF